MAHLMKALGLLVALAALAAPAAAQAGPFHGKLSGVVTDPTGIPQMGATVAVLAEGARSDAARELLTNERGIFSTERLLPGLYTVRVTLAGFLPALERHVRVEARLTTLLKIELASVFSSLERLRRQPGPETGSDDWTWILRTSAATRPVLRWVDGELAVAMEAGEREVPERFRPHGRVELTSGGSRPGSPSNIADAASSAFAFDQPVGHMGRLLMAGQVSYEGSAAGGFAALWLPTGTLEAGPQTAVVVRQSKLGPGGPAFRGVRSEHSGQMQLGERLHLRYGAEFIMVGLGASTSSLRPRAELDIELAPEWRASLILASRPWASVRRADTPLASAVNHLDAFPAVMLRNGDPVIEGGRHEELALERHLGPNSRLLASVFRDRSRHTAVFGHGRSLDPDFLQDFFSSAFVYDGGEMNSWGSRVVYQQKFLEDLEATLIYAWAGVLAPDELALSDADLRAQLTTAQRHSLAAGVKSRLPGLGTRVAASYKWINGPAVSRQDAFGEVAYEVDPFFSLSLRQPLPRFLSAGRFEALADFRNLFAQGYIPVTTQDGQILLIPAIRSFRGGLSFQF